MLQTPFDAPTGDHYAAAVVRSSVQGVLDEHGRKLPLVPARFFVFRSAADCADGAAPAAVLTHNIPQTAFTCRIKTERKIAYEQGAKALFPNALRDQHGNLIEV